MMEKKAALDAILRKFFPAFLEKCFETLNPGQAFLGNWHIDALTHLVQEIYQGNINRLIANLPPRHMKSLCFSVAAVAWFLGKDPTLKIICVSYSEDLAKKHARDCRLIMESDWYRAIFPNTVIDPRKNTETEVATTMQGYRLATSVGGSLTGRGAVIIIIDDPMKSIDASSAAERSRVNEWYGSTLATRLDDKESGIIVLVMHRLHQDDLAGHLLASGRKWKHLNLPAIATEPQRIEIDSGRFHERLVGDILHPTRESRSVLDDLRRDIGSASFEAQYQQAPVPPDGPVFKRAWLQFYKIPPANSEGRVVQSWDTASSLSEKADWSVCTTWLIIGKRYYLLNVLRGRWEFPALLKKAKDHAFAYHAGTVIIEDTQIGIGLRQQLSQEADFVVLKHKPSTNKIARAELVSPKVEEGRIILPEDASWLAGYLSEMLAFPNGRHDDQVDSTVQFLERGDPQVIMPRIWG